MSFHQPSMMRAGAAALISPDGSHRIPPELWPAYAAICLLEPEPAILALWHRRLEDALGVNEAHRKAVEYSPQEVRAFIRSSQEERGLRVTSSPDMIELPDAERGRGADDVKQLDRLNRRLTANIYVDTKGSTKEEKREADLRAREYLERSPVERAAEDLVNAGIAESTALAKDRGEEVETDKAGVRRILDHDPIAGLTWLTNEQALAAQELREAYERRADDLGAVEFTGMPGGAHDNDKFAWNRLQRAKATALIGKVERAVALDCRHEPCALKALRWVCGDGRSLTSLGRGRAYERNQKALAMALDVADDVIKMRR